MFEQPSVTYRERQLNMLQEDTNECKLQNNINQEQKRTSHNIVSIWTIKRTTAWSVIRRDHQACIHERNLHLEDIETINEIQSPA